MVYVPGCTPAAHPVGPRPPHPTPPPSNPQAGGPLASRFDFVIDAMFGFSFKGAPRPPFDGIIEVGRGGWGTVGQAWWRPQANRHNNVQARAGPATYCCTRRRCHVDGQVAPLLLDFTHARSRLRADDEAGSKPAAAGGCGHPQRASAGSCAHASWQWLNTCQRAVHAPLSGDLAMKPPWPHPCSTNWRLGLCAGGTWSTATRAAAACAPTCSSRSPPPSCARGSLRGRTTTWGAASCRRRWATCRAAICSRLASWPAHGGNCREGTFAAVQRALACCSAQSFQGCSAACPSQHARSACLLPHTDSDTHTHTLSLPAPRSATSTSCACRPTRELPSACASEARGAALLPAPQTWPTCACRMEAPGSRWMRQT